MNTPEGGRKVANTLTTKYGPDYFKKLGARGGRNGKGGGFASMSPEKRSEIGRKGAQARIAKQRQNNDQTTNT